MHSLKNLFPSLLRSTWNYSSVAVLACALLATATTGCRSLYGNDKRFELSGNEKRYELKGKVVSVDRVGRSLTVAHEEIKDYMPAMTMPFVVKEDWPPQVAGPGDEITATLVVDGTRSWLQDVVLKQSVDAATTETSGVPEAKFGDEVPDYRLTNQDGKRISIKQYRGKALLLTFIYTRCPIPEYCTLMSNNFAQIDQALQKDPEAYKRTHLLSITIDPDYDTPQVLRSYGAAHTGRYSDETFEHWEFAGGSKDEIKGIAQYFGLRYYEGGDQIVHGLRTVIVGPDGKVMKVYRSNEWKPEDVLKDLKGVLKGSKPKGDELLDSGG